MYDWDRSGVGGRILVDVRVGRDSGRQNSSNRIYPGVQSSSLGSAFEGLRISKIVFDPQGQGTGLNIDDISIRLSNDRPLSSSVRAESK